MDVKQEKKLECYKCYQSFDLKQDFFRYLVTKHFDTTVKCEVCGKISKNSTALAHHTYLVTRTCCKRPRAEGTFMSCEFSGCEKICKNMRYLARHVRSEHAENPVRFRCTLCNKEFKARQDLESHIPLHTTEKAFKCATCGRRFAHQGSLRKHEATHLEKSTRPIFQCRLCPVTVISTAVLERHVRVVHENQRNFPCTFCNRRFGSSYDLRRHVTARHPPNQEEIHACDKCEYQSHLKCRLDRHLRVHNDDEKLGCYFCGKTFVHFYRLVIHCRGLHLLEK
ncbi:Zinc finger protein OZF [Folsomia candida]|uniref:Zinc finger protein OZF n=1 Tax=Folsomia candida TaxID=158441 RepID=A0A226DTJ5_FOLCA|nr:Zinc finger protein OZF [Folsomia candida]